MHDPSRSESTPPRSSCPLQTPDAAASIDDELASIRDALRARDAELDAIFRAFPDLLFEVSADTTIVRYRAGSEEELYRAPSDFLGKRMADVLPPEPAAAITTAIERVLAGEPLICVEYELPMPGALKHYEARVVPFASERVILIVRDVTEQRRAQDERRDLDRKVEEAQRLESLGVLAGGIAHDFNNLLAAILGGVDLMKRHAQGGSPLSASIELVQQAARRASDLSRQLLVYAGKGRLEMRAIDIGALVTETAQLLGAAMSKRARFELDLAPQLPPIRGDVGQLQQVVMNVITNASDALGGRDGRIALRARGVERGVLLEIEDDGCGMDDTTRARMFDPFFSTKGRGRGLGLAAVQGIVRAHGGTIDVSSAPTRGTSVRIWLPGSRDEPVVTTASAPARESMEGDVVLVVDDDDAVRHVISCILEDAGFVAVRAQDGRHAIELFREHGAIDVVVMDMIMPQLAGDEAFVELRRIDPRIPVILVSGFDEDGARERLRNADPPPAFLRKPFESEALLAAIASALATRARERAFTRSAPP